MANHRSGAGLDREAIGARLGHERPGPTLLTALQVERSVAAHVSHFGRREAIQAVADNLPHGAAAAEVETRRTPSSPRSPHRLAHNGSRGPAQKTCKNRKAPS